MAMFKDWAWRPDLITLDAIRRGARKVANASYHAREDIINFNRESVRRQAQRGGSREYDQLEINTYLQRIAGDPSIVRGVYVKAEVGGVDRRKADGDVRGGGGSVVGLAHRTSVAQRGRISSSLGTAPRGGGRGVTGDQVRGSRAGRNVNKAGARAPRGSSIMSWATIVHRCMGNTRALGRFTEDNPVEAAKLEVAALPDNMRDVTVVQPGHDMRPFSNAELDALMKQFGDSRVGLKKEVKAAAVLHYLGLFEYTRHDDNGALTGEAYPPAPVETEVTEDTDKPEKKKGKKAKKKGKAVKAKTTNGSGKKSGAPKGDGLGRDGTPARFIRELLTKGTDAEKIAVQAAKKFPSNPITTTYVKWYANDMKKKGLLKA